jgi:hypothetical protein
MAMTLDPLRYAETRSASGTAIQAPVFATPGRAVNRIRLLDQLVRMVPVWNE